MALPDLPPALARRILQRVGEAGQPPEVGIEHLNVGNERVLDVLDREYLTPIATEGRGSSFKLVQAYFGGGKTHFLYCMRGRAWSRGMATALIDLSPDECPFDDPLRIYQAVAREIALAPADPTVPPARGIEQVLLTLFEDRSRELTPTELDRWVDTSLRRLPVDAPSFRAAVLAGYKAWREEDRGAEDLAAAWLRGEDVSASEVRRLGIREAMSHTNAFRMLRSLCQMLQAMGVPGILLAFDEMDRVLSLGAKRRRAIADNLRQLIDLCGREALPGLFCLYAVPPEFMRSVVTEYPALQQRLEGPAALSERSPQAAVIDLENLDLPPEEVLYQIGLRLLRLYGIAHDVSFDVPLQQQNLRALAAEVFATSFEVAHRRAFVKAAIDLLSHQAAEPGAVTTSQARSLARRGGELVVLPGGEEF